MSTATLRATADELDALAFGLCGEPFPDTGATLVAAAPQEHRGLVAARLLRSLALRGIVVESPQGPSVAPGFQALLQCRLAAEVTVLVRTRHPGSSAMAAICAHGDLVVVHSADRDGVHQLRSSELALARCVVAQLDPPAFEATDDRPLWMRYSDLATAVNPFAAAVRDFRYAAKLVKISAELATAAIVVGADGHGWLATVEPDDSADDGWLFARPLHADELPAAVTGLLTGNPSHSAARPDTSTLSS